MRPIHIFVCAVLVCGGTVDAAQPKAAAAEPAVVLQGNESPAQLREAYAKAIAEQLPGAEKNEQAAFKKIEEIFHHAARPGAEAERLACCQVGGALLAEKSDLTVPVKVWIIKRLTNAGKAEVVPTLSRLLNGNDKLLAETARCALQNNPAAEAAAALRDALAAAKGAEWQAALALALGARRDAASVPAIARLLKSKDEKAVQVAIEALGDIADASAAEAVAGATIPGSLQILAAESQMKCAEKLLAAGQNTAAAAVYKQLLKSPQRSVRMAALAGALRAAGSEAGQMTLEAIACDDKDAQQVAILHIACLNTAGVKAVAAGLDKLPVDRRLLVLDALANLGEKAALPAALAAAKSSEAEVRKAGLRALGPLGDATVVPLLVEVMLADDPDGVARASLLRVSCPKVNETLVGLLKKSDVAQHRQTLIEILEARGAQEVIPLLLPAVASDDANARRQAMRVLGKLAGPEHVAAMLPGLWKATGGERDEAEKAVMFACERIDDPAKRADPLLAALAKAASEEKLILLSVLGRVGGPKALEAVKTAVASGDAATREAGVRALSNWPDVSVVQDLLALAEKADTVPQRVMALRGLVRVVTIRDNGLNDKQKLAILASAMKLAERDQDKNLILERAGNVRHLDTLRFVAPYLDDPTTCVAAAKAVCDLARQGGLKSRERGEYQAALKKVIAVCKDKGVVERAQRELKDN